MSTRKKIRRKVQYRLVYWLVRALLSLSLALPRRQWLSFCGALGVIGYYTASKTRALMIKHLSLAFKEKSTSEIKDLAKRTFKMIGKNTGEILRSTQIQTLAQLEEILITTGLENYEVAHARGKGVIFLTCHLGAFDLQVTNMAMR